jgi:hypothetical protein
MDEEVVHRPGSRWEVRARHGSPRGDLYELEVKTRFQVVDRTLDEVVLAFEGVYEATWRDGDWTDATYTGVRGVTIAEDDLRALVACADGGVEEVLLPVSPAPDAAEGPVGGIDRRLTPYRTDATSGSGRQLDAWAYSPINLSMSVLLCGSGSLDFIQSQSVPPNRRAPRRLPGPAASSVASDPRTR